MCFRGACLNYGVNVSNQSSSNSGQIFVVATPIGNLGDMSPRAVETLQGVDLILAEDTRHSIPFLQQFQIQTKCQAFHEHNEREISEQLCQRVLAGESLALISDAGVPLISDPGFPLVRLAHQYHIPVVSIPGACALISALSVSGLATDRFSFEGFLPAKRVARQKILKALVKEPRTIVFYEAPRRLLDTLQDMVEIYGHERRAVLARELTKLFETVRNLPLGELLEFVQADENQRKGECVLLLEGVIVEESDTDSIESEELLRVLLAELPVKQAVALAVKITGAHRNQLYQMALQIKDE